MQKRKSPQVKPEEDFYTCAWSRDDDEETGSEVPVLALAGVKGLVRLLVPFKSEFRGVLVGHGSAIHDLRFHPQRKHILLSASKDCTMRLWNVKTNVCVAILGGLQSHCDEVLSAVSRAIKFLSKYPKQMIEL